METRKRMNESTLPALNTLGKSFQSAPPLYEEKVRPLKPPPAPPPMPPRNKLNLLISRGFMARLANETGMGLTGKNDAADASIFAPILMSEYFIIPRRRRPQEIINKNLYNSEFLRQSSRKDTIVSVVLKF
jgi:hypothetical protein